MKGALLALATVLAGCSQPTEIVLVVQLDETVPTVTWVRVTVEGTNRDAREPILVPPNVPITLGLTPASLPAVARVEVGGLDDASGLVVSTRAELAFVEGTRQMLYLELGRCAVDCAVLGRSCFRGSCRPVERIAPCAFEREVVDGRLATDVEACLADAQPEMDAGAGEEDAGLCGGETCGGVWSEVRLGGAHGCALAMGGALVCWGENEGGQLGDGTHTPRGTAVAVPGHVFERVAAGSDFTCATSGAGEVWCWGDNGSAQLGTTTLALAGSAVPVRVPYQAPAGIAAGAGFACGIDGDGVVSCWGANAFGQLGRPASPSEPAVAPVTGLPGGMLGVTAGVRHACAWGDAEVFCWGESAKGLLGGEPAVPDEPAQVALSFGDADAIAEVGAGRDHTCARTRLGRVICWGPGGLGQRGPGAADETPSEVALDSAATDLAVGATHTCVLDGSGRRTCWGESLLGALGVPGVTPVEPTAAVEEERFTALAAGAHVTCGLSAQTGDVFCWGYDGTGATGRGARLVLETPVRVTDDVSALALGRRHGCASGAGGPVRCWGEGRQGQLGDGRGVPSSTPVAQAPLGGTEVLVCGAEHCCAVVVPAAGGRALYCWGANRDGQTGADVGEATATPTQPALAELTVPSHLGLGDGFTCAHFDGGASGSVRCWGRDELGQHGDGAGNGGTVDLALSGLTAGRDHVIGHAGATIHGWGSNARGQIQNAAPRVVEEPFAHAPFSTVEVAATTAGDAFTCAFTREGPMLGCWGANDRAQLGDGTTAPFIGLVRPAVALAVTQLTAGARHACVSDGMAVHCWGDNGAGQLGRSPETAHRGPVPVAGLPAGIRRIAAGGRTTCAVGGGGELYCWGSDVHFAAGSGRAVVYDTPGPVALPPGALPEG